MSIRIWTARAHRLFPEVIKAMGTHLSGDESAVLLVPEQFTLAAERELMARLHLEGMFTLEVLSPSRLYEHVLNAAGRDEREPLSDAGRRMAVSQALEKLEDKLPYYGSITQRRGFVEKLCALITDMKRGGMTAESLAAYADSLPEGLQKAKLNDLTRIYEQYHAVLADRFSDSEDQLAYVAGRLAQSGYLSGRHLYVFGFDTLPQQLMRLLASAAPLCKSMTIALVCDGENAPDGELYAPVRQGIARFRQLLMQEGLQLEVHALPPSELLHAPSIVHLDKTLFVQPPSAFVGAPDVWLTNGLTPYEEATLASRQVMKLVADGMDIEQITVLYPDDSGYEFAVSAALADSGLPFYTDRQLPAASHGLVRFLLSALRAMAEGWRNRDMLPLLKSGYAPLTFDEACELENYLYVCGIDRKRWLTPFTRGEQTLRERCEALRLRVMEPLVKARQALVDSRDAAASMTAVFQLLMDVNAYDTLLQEEEKLLKSGLDVRANQNSQVWKAVLDLFDQLVRLGGSSRIPLKHIATRLECGFSAISLASLPPASGMLHAGALGHLLAADADAVFLLGMNDGLLSRSTESLLTEDERAKTQEDTGCFLGLTDENRMLQAKLDLKMAMTLPKQKLFLSYARTSADGAALRPLSLLNVLQSKLLPGLANNSVFDDDLPLSSAQALSQLSLILRAHTDGVLHGQLEPRWQERLNKLLSSPATAADTMRLLRSLGFDGAAQALNAEQARALFGEDVLTVSRLEQFADCPFKHFLNYGLRPHILREWKIDPIETGNFYHTGLNNFAKLARREQQYPNLPDARVEAMAEEAIAPLLDELMKGPMGDGERSLARFDLARHAIRRAALTMTRHLAAGKFALYRTEASFGYEKGMPPIVLLLSDGRQIALRGRIDRIDRYDAPDAVYLRVIDYKSSQQTLDAARTWWGLQLQLLLYLDVCTQAIPGAKPAGAFYFYVADPLVESGTDAAAVVEGKLRDLFQLRGIALSDVEIISAMDEGDVPCVLPPMYLKSGELKKTARALDEKQFAALLEHARQTASELAERLFGGENVISPIRDQSRTSCDFCDFRTICRFDCASPEAPFRTVPAMDMEELRTSLSGINAQEGQ